MKSTSDTKWWGKHPFLVEEGIAIIIGAIFFICSLKSDNGFIFGLVGLLFVLLWSILIVHRHFIKSYADNNYNAIKETTNAIHDEVKSINKLQDLIEASKSPEIEELIRESSKDGPKGSDVLKTKMIKDCTQNFSKLRTIKRVENLPPESSFAVSKPLLKEAIKGDEIIAVDFLKPGEWNNDNDCWREYIQANIDASQKTVVQRIFVVDDDKLAKIIKEYIITKHTIIKSIGEEKDTGLNAYIIKRTDYNTIVKQDTIYKRIEEGFFAIRKNNGISIAVIDVFYSHPDTPNGTDRYYRTNVTFSDEDIPYMFQAFRQLKEHIFNNTKRGK
jgi:hypothetical protein